MKVSVQIHHTPNSEHHDDHCTPTVYVGSQNPLQDKMVTLTILVLYFPGQNIFNEPTQLINDKFRGKGIARNSVNTQT